MSVKSARGHREMKRGVLHRFGLLGIVAWITTAVMTGVSYAGQEDFGNRLTGDEFLSRYRELVGIHDPAKAINIIEKLLLRASEY